VPRKRWLHMGDKSEIQMSRHSSPDPSRLEVRANLIARGRHDAAHVVAGQIRQEPSEPLPTETAGQWPKKGDDLITSDTLYKIGRMYEMGRSVRMDYAEALSCYRRAAASGHPAAQLALSYMYEDGRGVAKDENTAAYWRREASALLAAIREELASTDR